jgi:hypothetical protein
MSRIIYPSASRIFSPLHKRFPAKTMYACLTLRTYATSPVHFSRLFNHLNMTHEAPILRVPPCPFLRHAMGWRSGDMSVSYSRGA